MMGMSIEQMRAAKRERLEAVMLYAKQLGALGPRGTTAEHYVASLNLYFQTHDKLLACTPQSIAQGMLRVAQTGLELGVGCDLLPFKQTVQFAPRAVGLCELAYASGVRSINVDVVREGEPFEFRKGTRPLLDHTPLGNMAARILGAYVVAELKPGSFIFEYQSREQIDAIREEYSQKWWKDKFGTVIPLEEIVWWPRKRVIKMGAAMWPKNPRFAAAMMFGTLDADEDADGGAAPDADGDDVPQDVRPAVQPQRQLTSPPVEVFTPRAKPAREPVPIHDETDEERLAFERHLDEEDRRRHGY